MNKFLLRLLCVVTPLLIFGVTVEFVYTNIPNDYNVKKKFLETQMKDVKILVLGSSLSWRGINPIYFSKSAYNASFPGQSLKYDFLLLNKYIDSCKSLEDVIICVSYGDLRNTTEKLFPARTVYYSKYFGVGSSSDLFISQRRGISMLASIFRFYFNNASFVESDNLGFNCSEQITNMNFENNGKRVALFLTNNSNAEVESNTEYLKKIIEIGNRKHLKIHLITPPFSESLSKNIQLEQLLEMEKVCQDLVSTNTNVSYDNFMSDSDFSSNDYLNTNHLNRQGAKKLTLKINAKLGMASFKQ